MCASRLAGCKRFMRERDGVPGGTITAASSWNIARSTAVVVAGLARFLGQPPHAHARAGLPHASADACCCRSVLLMTAGIYC
jgi:hypothetical protein